MMSRIRPLAPAAALCLCFIWVACQASSRDAAARAGGGEQRAVALPNLDDFAESVRAQLSEQHARVVAQAGDPDADPASLGEAYGFLGMLLQAYELNHAAEPALLNAADLQPKDHRWHYYLGHLYRANVKLEAAAHHFERARAARPDYSPATIHLAEVYRQLGRETDAEKLVREIVRADPQNAVAHLLLGHLAAPNDPARAIEHYETVLRLQPGASSVRYPLAMAYREAGDLARSREQLAQRGQVIVRFSDPLMEELEKLRVGAGAKVYRGNMLLEEGRFAEAAALFEQAATEDPTNVSAHLNLAVAVSQLGDYPRAVAALREVLRLDPANSRARYNLGVLALYANAPGMTDSAIAHFRAAVAIDPGMSAARLWLGNLLYRQRRCRDAIVEFDTYLAERPSHIEARIRQAICHADRGEYPQARELLETGHRAFPADAVLQSAFIRILAASPDASVRDGERALRLAERLAAAQPSPETVEGLAMALAELGRYDEAIRYQREIIGAAESQGQTLALLEYLRSNLRSYEQGKPCRAPWPPTVFDQ